MSPQLRALMVGLTMLDEAMQSPPRCERCHRTHDVDGEPIRRADNDWCGDCNFHVGWAEHGPYAPCPCGPCERARTA